MFSLSKPFPSQSRRIPSWLPSANICTSWIQESSWERKTNAVKRIYGLLVAQRQRICLPVQETRVQSLGWEDPLEKEMANHSSILAWRIPWAEGPGGLQSLGLQKSQTWLSEQTKTTTMNLQMFKLDLEKAEEPEIKLPISVVSWKKQESSRKNLLLLYWLHQNLWLCESQQTVENS